MNIRRSSYLWAFAIVAAVVSAGVLMAAARQDPSVIPQARPKPEKLCPITFHLDPTTLQSGYSRHVERVNARLAQDLVDLRNRAALYDPKLREGLAEEYAKLYSGTYLAFPVLWDEHGEAHTGWFQVLSWLATALPVATFIHPQAVNVFMEYLPLANRTEAYLKTKLAATMKQRGRTELWFDYRNVDFLASIRTVLAFAPYDDPVQIGNEDPSPHQNICDPIF